MPRWRSRRTRRSTSRTSRFGGAGTTRRTSSTTSGRCSAARRANTRPDTASSREEQTRCVDPRDLAYTGAAEQARLLASGAVTAPALLDVYLDRIARLDGELHSYRVV